MSVIELYEKLSSAPDDKTRARIIAEAFETLEERYPNLSDIATHQHLRETELCLLREIEQVRADLSIEIEQVRADLSKEIEQVRADLSKEIEQVRTDLSIEIEHVRSELKETELRLQKEIETAKLELQKEIDMVKLEIKATEIRLTQAIHRQTLWVIGSIGTIIAAIRLLEWFLNHATR